MVKPIPIFIEQSSNGLLILPGLVHKISDYVSEYLIYLSIIRGNFSSLSYYLF